jgi:hypothetical protein
MPLQPFNLGLRMMADGFSPLSLTPALWLDASDAATLFQDSALTTPAGEAEPVGGWKDKSGNGRHFTQSGTSRPMLYDSGPNGQHIVAFDGVDDSLAKATDAGFPTGDFTLVTVAISNKAVYSSGQYGPIITWGTMSSGAHILSMWGTDGGGTGTNAYACNIFGDAVKIDSQTSAWKSFASMRSGTSHTIYLNGVLSATKAMANSTTLSANPVTIGYAAFVASYAQCYIAEMILVPRALTATEISTLQTYLAAKWGI